MLWIVQSTEYSVPASIPRYLGHKMPRKGRPGKGYLGYLGYLVRGRHVEKPCCTPYSVLHAPCSILYSVARAYIRYRGRPLAPGTLKLSCRWKAPQCHTRTGAHHQRLTFECQGLVEQWLTMVEGEDGTSGRSRAGGLGWLAGARAGAARRREEGCVQVKKGSGRWTRASAEGVG